MTSSRQEGHGLPAPGEAAAGDSTAPARGPEPAAAPCADERWLLRWLPLLRERAAERYVLELGCGKGRDTRVLQRAGLRVVGVDRSALNLEEARRAAPGASFLLSDLRAPLPRTPGEVGAIVASLCLHYFDWAATLALADRLRSCLAPDRPLICRVNSTRDVHHGATGHPEIEPGYYRVGSEPKRFFSRADVLRLFGDDWQIVSLEEQTIDRYPLPKVIWELVARPC